jgi:UMF1 family MFS transporter
MAGPRAISRLSVASWVTYDLANTIFSMGIVSMFFPAFVERAVGAEQVGRVFGTIQSISYFIIFIIAPVLGAMTDRARRRMPFLVWTTFLCVGATVFIGRGSFLSSAVLFIFANAAYQAGIQFYDSLLIEVTTEENRGRVSGIGTGIGYLGSYIAVGLGFLLNEAEYRTPAEYWPLFVWIALSFLALAIPCFLLVRERGNPSPRPVFEWAAIRSSAAETVRTIKEGREYPGLIRFLVGRVFYTDAINTVIGYMSLYAIHTSIAAGMSETEAGEFKNLVMLVAISCAVVAGLLWGRANDRLGPKRALNLVLGLLMFSLLFAAAQGGLGLPAGLFYIVGSLIGICMAGIWSVDRPYMLRLTPPHRVGEFYGLYGMVGRFSAITGPAIWAVTTWLLVERMGLAVVQGEAIAILLMLGFVIISYVILQKVSDRARVPQAPRGT